MIHPDCSEEALLHQCASSQIVPDHELTAYLRGNRLNDASLWFNDSTALHIACQEGNLPSNIKYIEELIRNGASIYCRNAVKSTPLIIAAEHGNIEAVKLLIGYARINDELSPENRPQEYMTAAEYVGCGNEYEQTALMLAIERSHPLVTSNELLIVRWIAAIYPAQLEKANKYEKIPLLIACEFGKYLVAKFILLHMMHENMPEGLEKESKGVSAAEIKHFSSFDWTGRKWVFCARDLFDNRKFQSWLEEETYRPLRNHLMAVIERINGIESNKNTPLMFACGGTTREHEKIAHMLLELPDINIQAENLGKQPALVWAGTYGSCRILHKILSYYDSVDQPVKKEHLMDTLRKLCQFNHEISLALLLNYINQTDYSPDEKWLIRGRCLRHAWKHGNVKIATIYFMVLAITAHDGEDQTLDEVDKVLAEHQVDWENFEADVLKNVDEDVQQKVLDHVATKDLWSGRCLERRGFESQRFGIVRWHTSVDVDEMYRRLSCNPESIKALFRYGALYDFHFEVLEKMLYQLDNPLTYVDSEISAFYQTMEDLKITDLNLISHCARATLRVEPSVGTPTTKKLQFSDGQKSSGKHSTHAFYRNKEEMEQEERLLSAVGLVREYVPYPDYITDVDVIEKLVLLATFFSYQKRMKKMLRVSFGAHLNQVETMLLKCFSVSSLANLVTMQKFLPRHEYLPNSLVRHAYSFRDGPLWRCINYNISKVFKSVNVIALINTLYWGLLKPRVPRHWWDRLKRIIRSIMLADSPYLRSKRLFNLTNLHSDFIYLRHSPAGMFFLQGLSKLTLLILVSFRAALHFEDYMTPPIIVWVVATMLYEFGQLCQCRFIPVFTLAGAKVYFDSIWNRIDLIGNALLILAVIMDAVSSSSSVRVVYAVASIFLSLSILEFAAAYEPVGLLIFMIFAMMADLMVFAIIFLICVFGFCVAVYSIALVENISEFDTPSSTFIYLFLAALANVDDFKETFGGFSTVNQVVIVLLTLFYVIFAAVMLLNLVIARMSATYTTIDSNAMEQWQLNRALTVMSNILLEERSPFCMLPPPFNLISTIISVFDYAHLYYWVPHWLTAKQKKEGAVVISFAGTAMDVILGLLMSFVSPWLEWIGYLTVSANSHDTPVSEVLCIVLLFPFISPIYTLSLIISSLLKRTHIVWKIDPVTSKAPSSFPIMFSEFQNPERSPNEHVGTAVLKKLGHQNDSVKIRIVRMMGDGLKQLMNLKEDYKPLLIVRIQLQEMISNTGQGFDDTSRKGSYLFESPLCTFPSQRLVLSKDHNIKLKFILIDQNQLNYGEEELARITIDSTKIRSWLANGRYEDALYFDGVDIKLVITFAATAEVPSYIRDGSDDPDDVGEFSKVIRDLEDDEEDNEESTVKEGVTAGSVTAGSATGSSTIRSKSTKLSTARFGGDEEEEMGKLQLFTAEERKQIFLSLREADEILYDLRNMLDGRLQDLEVKGADRRKSSFISNAAL